MSDTLRTIQRMLNKKRLDIVGSFDLDRSDNVCSKAKTILLLGPKEPFFWDVCKKLANIGIKKKTHVIDGQKNQREIAIKLNVRSFFSFETPFQPFYDWAKKCSTIGSSPVSLLAHKEKGLFISFRVPLV